MMWFTRLLWNCFSICQFVDCSSFLFVLVVFVNTALRRPLQPNFTETFRDTVNSPTPFFSQCPSWRKILRALSVCSLFLSHSKYFHFFSPTFTLVHTPPPLPLLLPRMMTFVDWFSEIQMALDAEFFITCWVCTFVCLFFNPVDAVVFISLTL